MNITVEKQPNCTARLQVKVPADTVSGERQSIVQAFSRQAKIPGFRPGKIPRKVIEKRFAEQIAEELESRLMNKAFEEAIKQEDLRVLDVKTPDEKTVHPDGTFTLASTLVLAPEFELPDYKSITLEMPDRQIEEADIDKELEELRNRFSEFNAITERPLAEGDFAIIDYSSSLGGLPLEEAAGEAAGALGGGEAYWLKMDGESFLPGFSKELEGAKIDEERAFSLALEDDFPVEAVRGKSLDFKVKVTEIKEQVLPDLDDALAEQIMPGKSLAELREVLTEQLEQRLERQLGEFKINQLIEKLNKAVEFELPEHLVTAETQGQADQLVEQGISSGMSEEAIEAQQGEIFAAAGQRARLNIKTDFILQEIAQVEKLEVSTGELGARVAALAKQAGKPLKPFAKELKSSGRLRGLNHNMLLSKTIDFLLDGAKVELVTESSESSESTDESDA